MRRQTRTRFSPRLNIGDGKLPNKYVVSGSNDFLVNNNGVADWASEKLGLKPKTILREKTFNKFKDAMKYADEKAEMIPEDPRTDTLNHITVEDRLSGEVATIGVESYKSKKGILNTIKTTIDRRIDTRFTEKTMKEKGVKFE